MLFFTFDNFFSDPIKERELALKAEYKTEEHNGLHYKGIALCKDPENISKIENLLSEKLLGESTVYYRRYLESEEGETYIHSDSQIGRYTCIAYLTEDELCQGGTAFWRHRKYGWEFQPTKDEMHRLGLKDSKEFWDEIYQDGFDETKWELLGVAPMKYNRAIVFDSRRFHSRYPKRSFGHEVSTSRLVKVFFLNEHPNFYITPFDPQRDYNEVCRWWAHYEWPPIPLDHLPKRGFVIWDKMGGGKAIACCWLYATDSAISWLEFLISNPDISGRTKVPALELLVQTACSIAFSSGAKSIWSSVAQKGLIRLYERNGFKVSDHKMTNLVRTQGGTLCP